MKKVIFFWSNLLFFVALPHAMELTTLTTPGAERDRLEQKHRSWLQSGQDSLQALRELGIIYHMKAVEGLVDIHFIRESHSLLKKAYTNDKTHAVTKAYLGSITTMMAITVEGGMQKMKLRQPGNSPLG